MANGPGLVLVEDKDRDVVRWDVDVSGGVHAWEVVYNRGKVLRYILYISMYTIHTYILLYIYIHTNIYIYITIYVYIYIYYIIYIYV